ncbi:MAG: hypothetical protein ABIG39_00175 [Candidatus Micrarchaeota archaeon]
MQKQGALDERAKRRKREATGTVRIIDICENVFSSFTHKELDKQRSKVNKARKAKKIPLLGWLAPGSYKGIPFDDLDILMDSVASISDSSKKREDIMRVIDKFPDGIVSDYAEKITDVKKSLKTLKSEYSETDEEARRNYYGQLRRTGFAPSFQSISNYLRLDSDLKLLGGQENMRFPTLGFYHLLLISYDEKNPPEVFGADGLTEMFVKTIERFLAVSQYLASKSETFEAFDAKMNGLKSFDIPRVVSN